MTEPNPMLLEMNEVQNTLRVTAARTKDKFDERMRATVKDLLGYRYALENVPVEEAKEVRGLISHRENAIRIGDAILRMDSDKQIQFMRNNAEWNRTRPVRIYNYVQKIADIFPAEHLIKLLRTSLKHTAKETITIYEANKGEAKQSDYAGKPTEIDRNQTKYHATLVRSV